MTEAIRFHCGAFGRVSLLTVARNFVTHAHSEAHVIIWLDGAAGEMTIGGRTVRLGRRVAAGINSFEPHSHALPRHGLPGSFLAFYLDPLWLSVRRGLPVGAPVFANPAIPLAGPVAAGLAVLIARLREPDLPEHVGGHEIARIIDGLIDAADHDRVAEAGAGHPPVRPDFRVRKAADLMRAHVADRIGLDDIARRVGLSRPHFFCLFREQMHITPNVYWNTLRMEEALRRLQDSDLPMIALACDLGFTSQGNFSRFFSDHAGVPPSVYRSAIRTAA